MDLEIENQDNSFSDECRGSVKVIVKIKKTDVSIDLIMLLYVFSCLITITA